MVDGVMLNWFAVFVADYFRPEVVSVDVPTGDCFRLVAVVLLRNANDCCCPEQSLRQDFEQFLLYTSKLLISTQN